LGTIIKSKPLPNISDSFIQNVRVIFDKIEIVNKFNQYFVDIGSDLASKIPPTKVDISSYLKGNFSSSFSLYFTDAMEIISVVSSLQNKSSAGHDSIPVNIMKSSILHIAEPIAKLINC